MQVLVLMVMGAALMEDMVASVKSPIPRLESHLSTECPPEVTCDGVNINYRTADGSCNNLRYPEYGMSFTKQDRLASNTYDDGVGAFRTRATNGGPLPNVREISMTIMTDANKTDPNFTLSLMQFSQFMDHDLTLVPFTTFEHEVFIDCCPSDPATTLHESCRPINISADPFYSQFGATCMNFTRSVLAKGFGEDCIYEISEQVNSLTPWVDGSNIYGSTHEVINLLRRFEDGLLDSTANQMLPINPFQGGECEAEANDAECFLAGDIRVNEQPGLTSIHTLFMREHNRIATQMKILNPHWDDETLFQETRRIVVAEFEHIAFNEWLPIIVGQYNLDKYDLRLPDYGFTYDYDDYIFPNIFNEFAAACFRYGHTLVQGLISTFSNNGSLTTIQLRENFNSPHQIQHNDLLDDIIRGLFMSNVQTYDNCITEDLTSHLFQPHGQEFGMDLMSLNMQRGRDHGIGTYNTIRKICGLKHAHDFQDLIGEIPEFLIARLESVYDHVDDIDLWAGGIAEPSIPGGSILGPTFACVVSMQFEKLKKGDRFFYTHGGLYTSFTENQLNNIRNASWARIICDNSGVDRIQRDAFRVQGPQNEAVDCSELKEVMLDDWEEYY